MEKPSHGGIGAHRPESAQSQSGGPCAGLPGYGGCPGELAKFKPSLEVDETEKAILNDKMVDITDILQELMNEIKK